MSSRGLRFLGLACVAGAIIWFIGWSLWVQAQWAAGKLDRGAALLGIILFAVVPAIPAAIAGGVFLVKATARRREERLAQLDARLLEAVRTRGIVKMRDLAQEWHVPLEQVRAALERVVGMGLFDGRVDWSKGEAYAPTIDPSQSCPRCGGTLKPVGKGLARCEFCGSSYPVGGSES